MSFAEIRVPDEHDADSEDTPGFTPDAIVSIGSIKFIQMSGTASTYSLNNGKAAATVTVDDASTVAIDSRHVDHYSRIFSFLSQAIGYDNVWQNKKVSPSTVVRYVNISSPEIVLESAPDIYTEQIGKEGNFKDDTLTISFKIKNTTDPSPSTTTYTGTLYLDKDNNGLYTDDEVVSDMVIAGGDGSDETNYAESMKGGISEDSAPSYSASVVLPDDMVGAVSWKLVVTQNPDSENADTEYMPHASVKRISYKASRNDTRPVINVLQVNSDSQGQLVYNLEEANKENPAEGTKIDSYHKWLTNSTVTDKYKINIITVNASDFNNNRYPDRSTTELERDGETYKIESGQPIDLDAYDMIVLGFSDSYGSLSLESCNKVQGFADSGKSVLFTHDNSSHAYVPKTSDQYSWYYKGDGTYAWGAFFFNITLRALDQMDVYGITDTKLGSGGVAAWNVEDSEGNKITDGFLAQKNPYQNESDDVRTSLTSEEISKLQAAGYSIAYKPESVDVDDYDPGKVVTVPQTQAYTDGFLYRFGSTTEHNSDSWIENLKDLKTTSVKQVNKGTITTYPYDLGSGNLNVSTTHCQYSQLNLNSDKIVVWYTLDGSNWGYKEDPVNNYYLFSCGNIFYTGAGHEDYPKDDEAKLFINTMIAAYRQQATKPRAYFTGSAKSTKQVSSYLVQTGGKTMSAIDVLRSYIEDFTGNDTSQYTDQDFKDRSPVKDLDMTVYDLNIAAKAATIRLAYSMTNDDKNRGTEAINRIQNLKLGPWLGSDSKVIDGVTSDTTVSQICAGINTLLLGKTATYNEAVPGLTPDKNSVKDQKYYFTIKDDNTGTKTITPKFYLYSTKQIDNIDTNRFKETKEENDGRTTGYYYDITSAVTEYEPKSDNVTTSFSSNKIYGLKLDENNPALDILLEKGTVTIAIEPSVEVKSKKKTMTGQKTKVTINTAGLLQLG